MVAEGQIILKAAETVEGNQASFVYDQEIEGEIERLQHGMGKSDFTTEHIKELFAKREKAMMDDREKIAIDKITSDSDNHEKTRVLIFGGNHNFTDELVAYNERTGEVYGLISVIEKD